MCIDLKKLYEKIVQSALKRPGELVDLDAWRRLIESLPEPEDGIQESHNRYLCRMAYFGAAHKVLLNTTAALGLLIEFARNGFSWHAAVSDHSAQRQVSLLLVEDKAIGLDDIIPGQIADAQGEVVRVGKAAYWPLCLTRDAADAFRRLRKQHRFDFYFSLLALKELSVHSHYIEKYNPEAVAVYVEEDNVVAPLLTELYEKRGSELLSFMHGDYVLQLAHAFLHFSRFYVWSPSYERMFVDELRCNPGQMTVYTPKKHQKKWGLEGVNPSYDFTYYFSNETKAAVDCVASAFGELQRRGFKCKVRPHPRWSQGEYIRKAFSDTVIEDPHTISLEDSLGATAYAVGLNTSVLIEAYVEGRLIVIDDVSDKGLYDNLKERHLPTLSLQHLLLSDCLKGLDGAN